MVKEELKDCQLRFVHSIIKQHEKDGMAEALLKRRLIDADQVNQCFCNIIKPLKFNKTIVVNDVA